MIQVAITGASGFIGKHLVEALERREGVRPRCVEHTGSDAELAQGLQDAAVVFHLAGVNRPQSECESDRGKTACTRRLCDELRNVGGRPLVVLASSTHAALDDPHGRSMRRAEAEVERFALETGAAGVIFRLTNVFGKWCRPSDDSVIASLCHNVAHDLPITVSDPAREVTCVYVDDVIAGLVGVLDHAEPPAGCRFAEIEPTYTIKLGELVERVTSFRATRGTLTLPDFLDPFTRYLYATYLSYLGKQDFAYALEQRSDARGTLAEFLKSDSFGQIFVSRTRPGAVRGNHYHHTKAEKFLVVDGDAVIRFQHLVTGDILEYPVSGLELRVVDIPPGYAHSIQNVGTSELIVLFWASEVFDPARPDTYAFEVPRT